MTCRAARADVPHRHAGCDRSITAPDPGPSMRTPTRDDPGDSHTYAGTRPSRLPPPTPLASTQLVPSARTNGAAWPVITAGSAPGAGKRRSSLLHGSTRHNTDGRRRPTYLCERLIRHTRVDAATHCRRRRARAGRGFGDGCLVESSIVDRLTVGHRGNGDGLPRRFRIDADRRAGAQDDHDGPRCTRIPTASSRSFTLRSTNEGSHLHRTRNSRSSTSQPRRRRRASC